MAANFIVAIELGSSKVIGVAGKKKSDGSINVLAVVSEDSSSFIRKGVVYNIDKTARCLANIVNKLTAQLKTEIKQVYVGVGGQSIRSVRNPIVRNLPADTKITQDMVIELMDANSTMIYPGKRILDVATQEYRVDSQMQLDPVGIQCSRFEGNFLNILGRDTFFKNLDKCFEAANIKVVETYVAPLALADSVLSEAERRSGCALVDIGADTTTVCVFSKNILRHLSVIPLGSNNVTKDLTSLQIEDDQAESLKLKYGRAFTDNSEIDKMPSVSIDSDRSVEYREFSEIVETRMEEIIENVMCQIPADYSDKLFGGIILTGGGSNMRDIEEAFTTYASIEKVRVAKFVNQTVQPANPSIVVPKDGTMNTVLGMLAKGDINCAGGDVPDGGGLFATRHPKSVGEPRTADVPIGVVRKAADEEARRKKEEEERLARQKAEEEEQRLEAERKANSLVNRGMRWLKDFGRKIISEE